MPVNKAEIGGRILNSLLSYGKLIERKGPRALRIGRNVIKTQYYPLDLTRLFTKQLLYNPGWVQQNNLKRFTNHSLYVGFKGKLDFYKDFYMYYNFVDNDDDTQRLRGITEKQYHGELYPYLTTTYALRVTDERIHSMLYDALNIAFGYKDNLDKFEKLIEVIEVSKIREV